VTTEDIDAIKPLAVHELQIEMCDVIDTIEPERVRPEP